MMRRTASMDRLLSSSFSLEGCHYVLLVHGSPVKRTPSYVTIEAVQRTSNRRRSSFVASSLKFRPYSEADPMQNSEVERQNTPPLPPPPAPHICSHNYESIDEPLPPPPPPTSAQEVKPQLLVQPTMPSSPRLCVTGFPRRRLDAEEPKQNERNQLNECRDYGDYRATNTPGSTTGQDTSTSSNSSFRRRADSFGLDRTPIARTVVCSLLSALFVSTLLLLCMFGWYDYSLRVAVTVSAMVLLFLSISLCISRMVRCALALILPSIITTRGRLGCLILLSSLLLKGPADNIFQNVEEVCRSLSCSTEQSHNQTAILLQPFDAMMQQLNHTTRKLQYAALNVSNRFRPLNRSLIEADRSLVRSDKIIHQSNCRNLIKKAHADCENGIQEARSRCDKIVESIADVVMTAQSFFKKLETNIPNDHIEKRRAEEEKSARPKTNEDRSKLMCKPLQTGSVCSTLANPKNLCVESDNAGGAIRRAINATQSAMEKLENSLHFSVSPSVKGWIDKGGGGGRGGLKSNQNKTVSLSISERIEKKFRKRIEYVQLAIEILHKMLPISLLLIANSAFRHIKVTPDNRFYI
ncbi:DgyrCDS13189 [Dimorphilus gyrociliatus]|uniref:DgyrCDS13189 n=1 Tax=Dimorphilus gyrociliatus TaxID=2664684 RepID=A0A7I8W9Y3_9ANNE|nr:DgyrCDS13189 [Dimorphilus gyrociliatus]